MLKHRANLQAGVSLVELMIGSAVGLIVIAATVATYVAIARSGSEILSSAKLNAELRAAMDLMIRDIRRAGSWTATLADRELGANPFTRRTGALITDVNIFGSGGVIEFSYNGSFLGSANGTVFGYRIADNAVKALQCNIETSPSTLCNTGAILANGWEKLTDENNVVITSLSFQTTGSRCLNLTQSGQTWVSPTASTIPACDPSTPGYVATTNDRLIEKRQIRVRLAGKLKRREEFTMVLEESVLLANDRVFNVP
jgi:prepilin peptidase dependent protein B